MFKWLWNLFFGSDTPRRVGLPAPQPALFRRLCPKCATEREVAKDARACPSCKYEWSEDYLSDLKSAPPLFFPILGFGGTGKTVYLYALIHALHNLSMVIQEFSPAHQDEATRNWVRDVMTKIRDRSGGVIRLPEKTLAAEEPVIIKLRSMRHWSQRQLVIRDVPGERFHAMDVVEEPTEALLPFLAGSEVCCMAVDVSGDEAAARHHREGRDPNYLMEAYVRALKKAKVKGTRTVIVLLTKGDRLKEKRPGQPTLPPNVTNHLDTDEILPRLGPTQRLDGSEYDLTAPVMAEYREMGVNAGKYIRESFVEKLPVGRMLINAAKEAAHDGIHIQLRFVVVAAAGAGVEKQGNAFVITCGSDPNNPMSSSRVLDPLFIALDTDSIPVSNLRQPAAATA